MKIFGRGVVVCATAFMLGAWMPCAVPAAENRVDSRMFELTYADAKEVAENFNRTWRGQAPTNGNWGVGEIAVPFVEVNSVMVTAPEAVLETCARMMEMERARSPATARMQSRASSRSTFATSRTVRARRNASDRRDEGYKVRERRG